MKISLLSNTRSVAKLAQALKLDASIHISDAFSRTSFEDSIQAEAKGIVARSINRLYKDSSRQQQQPQPQAPSESVTEDIPSNATDDMVIVHLGVTALMSRKSMLDKRSGQNYVVRLIDVLVELLMTREVPERRDLYVCVLMGPGRLLPTEQLGGDKNYLPSISSFPFKSIPPTQSFELKNTRIVRNLR